MTHSLIVGGTRGLGRALVQLWSESGHTVSVIGRRPPESADEKLPGVRFWTVDITDDTGLASVLREIIVENGLLASIIFFQRYRGKGDDWRGELETSLTSTKNIIEALSSQFDGTENAIVIVTSVAGNLVAEEQGLGYHVAKAGLIQMVRYLAVMLGPKGIRVNSVSPGTILKEESRGLHLMDQGIRNMHENIIPLGRMGTSQEVAHTIEFLCSSKASFITGQDLVVDGGLSLLWQGSSAWQVPSGDAGSRENIR